MGTHTIDWREVGGQYQSRLLNLSSKTLGFFSPKQTAKKFVWSSWGQEVQIRNCRSFPSLQMNQSSHPILASPTWHTSACAWGWFPRRWVVGWQGGRSTQCWASSPPSDPLAWGRKIPESPEEQRLAGQLKMPKSHSPMPGRVCSWTACAFKSGWQSGTKPTGTILKMSWYKRPCGGEEPSALNTTTGY